MARVSDTFILSVAGTRTGPDEPDRVLATITINDGYDDGVAAQQGTQFAVGFQYTIGLPNMTQAFALKTTQGASQTGLTGAGAPRVDSFTPIAPLLSRVVNGRSVPAGINELQDCTLLATVPSTMTAGNYTCEIWSDQP